MTSDISLFILDIAQNSFKAGADCISVHIKSTVKGLAFRIADNGKGFDKEALLRAERGEDQHLKTGGKGLLSLYNACGGRIKIRSTKGCGSSVLASFDKSVPTGDVSQTLMSLLILSQNGVRIKFRASAGKESFLIDTDGIKAILGDVSILERNVYRFLDSYVKEGLESVFEEKTHHKEEN